MNEPECITGLHRGVVQGLVQSACVLLLMTVNKYPVTVTRDRDGRSSPYCALKANWEFLRQSSDGDLVVRHNEPLKTVEISHVFCNRV